MCVILGDTKLLNWLSESMNIEVVQRDCPVRTGRELQTLSLSLFLSLTHTHTHPHSLS